MSSSTWREARAQMLLDPTVANLNTGSFGPLPGPVFERVTELRRRLAAEPMDFLVRQAPPLLASSRQRFAEFLGGNPLRLIFTANVTAAVNLVAASLRLAAPGEILLTDHEYGAMHWCWERAAQHQGLSIRTFQLPIRTESPAAILASFTGALRDRTRLAFFSHVLSPTGLVLPVAEICREARRRGVLTMIDGAHAPGMLPVNLDALKCDFYGGNAHKWLLAPTGAGFLYLGQGNEERLQPHQVSWGWNLDRRRADEADEFGSTPRIRHLEFEGTRDPCAWLTVPTAIDFQAGLGWQHIRERNVGLVRYVRNRLSWLPPVTPENPVLHGFLTTFQLPSATNPNVLRQRLWQEHRIEAPIIERPDGALFIRVSTHFYNTEEELDRLASALRDLLRA